MSVKTKAGACRSCTLYRQAREDLSVDRLYAWLKNMLSFLGYEGFEAELYRFVEGLKK